MRYHVMDGVSNTPCEEASDKVLPYSYLKTEIDFILIWYKIGSLENTGYPNGVPNWGTYLGGYQN